jgi:hypothetical protein
VERCGIAVEPQGLSEKMATDLRVSYREALYWTGCSPVGIAIGNSGAFYVAMRSLGVLRFSRRGNGYDMAQLCFDRVSR